MGHRSNEIEKYEPKYRDIDKIVCSFVIRSVKARFYIRNFDQLDVDISTFCET